MTELGKAQKSVDLISLVPICTFGFDLACTSCNYLLYLYGTGRRNVLYIEYKHIYSIAAHGCIQGQNMYICVYMCIYIVIYIIYVA